jgi:hypothetical protein
VAVLQDLWRTKQRLYRLGKYHLVRARPPVIGLLEGKTVVVVGSAPFSTPPQGWDDTFRVMTINASQIAARAWLSQRPDVTLMQFNQIEGQNTTASEVRRVLRDQHTGFLYVLNWRHDMARLERGLAAFGYHYSDLRVMGRYERIALMRAVTGVLNLELETEMKWSNGIVGAALALHSGAARVILTGIDPGSTGHGYNQLGLTRRHAQLDSQALDLFMRGGRPVFTADPQVADTTPLPLWTGK